MTTKDQNIARGDAMGCASLVDEAVEAGASDDDIAVSLDMFDERGLDACRQFLFEQTGRLSFRNSWWIVQEPLGIEDIPGRRLWYCQTAIGGGVIASVEFGIRMMISQDGPFIMTHFPVMLWSTDGEKEWLPVGEKNSDGNTVRLSYGLMDEGSQRNLTNGNISVFSAPDRLNPVPMATLFAPNSTIQLSPIVIEGFGAGEASIKAIIPGYRIVNL